MAARTTVELVAAAIKKQTAIDAEPHIRTATALVDYIVSKDTAGVLTSELLLEIETYLAAHFYALLDPQLRQESRGKASGTFVLGQEGQGLKATPWGQQAIALDITGELSAISSGKQKVGITWLGTTPAEARPHWTR